ncbi:hypothetical protein TSPI_07618, partial [Trichinella spiralis]
MQQGIGIVLQLLTSSDLQIIFIQTIRKAQ